MRSIFAMLLAAVVVFPLTASGTIWYVPDNFGTIQEGIDGIPDGDTLIVREGTYYENLNFNGHNVVLASLFLTTGDTAYISSTIVDGASAGSVITIESGEDSTTQVVGLTIQNGDAQYGAGIRCSQSHPTIVNNIITANFGFYGGGVYCDESNSTVSRNVIVGNGSSSGGGICSYHCDPTISDNAIEANGANHGGGICCRSSSSSIVKNSLRNNSADFGGGIYCEGGRPSIEQNTIRGNRAEYDGGGISCYFSSPTISKNTIRGNSARSWSGGGISCYESYGVLIYSNIISGNSASGGAGGGISCFATGATIRHNTVSDNAAERGGGVHCAGRWAPLICNNTIALNSADSSGGGIYCYYSTSPTILNTILWGDEAPNGQEIYLEAGASPTVTYCDVQGGWPGEGNIDVDPLFRDPTSSDFHLMADYCGDPDNSPCIDAGHPDSLDALLDCFHGLGSDRADMGSYGGRNSGWPTGIENGEGGLPIPSQFLLLQNYPNPFNATTVIEYQLPARRYVKLEVCNILGQRVITLVDERQQAGYKSIIWNPSDVSSGLYFYKLTAGDYTETKRMMLVK